MNASVDLVPALVENSDVFEPISNLQLNLLSEYILCSRFGKILYSTEFIKNS